MYSTGGFAMPVEAAADGWFDPLREPAAGRFATRADVGATVDRIFALLHQTVVR